MLTNLPTQTQQTQPRQSYGNLSFPSCGITIYCSIQIEQEIQHIQQNINLDYRYFNNTTTQINLVITCGSNPHNNLFWEKEFNKVFSQNGYTTSYKMDAIFETNNEPYKFHGIFVKSVSRDYRDLMISTSCDYFESIIFPEDLIRIEREKKLKRILG